MLVLPRAISISALCVCSLVLSGAAVDGLAAPKSSNLSEQPVEFARDVKPLLQKLCSNCHGAKDRKGHLQIEMLDHELSTGKDSEAWHDVLDRVNLGEMPPSKAMQPTKAERQILVEWLTAGLRQAAKSKRHFAGRVVM